MSPDPRRLAEPRDRITTRVNRDRLQLEAKRGARPFVVVVVGVVIGLLVAVYIATNVSRTLLSKNQELAFAVEDATGVVEGANEVRLKGIAIGTITRVETQGSQAVLLARVQKRYGDVFRDARAELRPNTALQDMYLDVVDRGTAKAGKLDADTPLAPSRTAVPVSVNEVLGVFSTPVRVRLRTLLDELGGGMEGNGARLRTAFQQAAPFIDQLGQVTKQLADREPMVAQLVTNTGILTEALAERQTSLDRLVTQGSRTLTTLKDGRGDLAATLEALPPTLDAVDTTFTAVRGVLGDVDTAVRALGPVSDELPGSLDALLRLNRSAAPAVAALQAPVKRLVPLSASLRPLSSDLSRVVRSLQPQVDTVDKVTGNLAGCRKGVVGFFQWNASISKLGDSNAGYPRGNLTAGAQSTGVLSDPSEFAPAACTPGRPIGGRPARPGDGR
ncbi:MAG: MCE-family protein Mce6D [Solirubrobacterales bacterium]|nr:MCE-family protein Mce6D [Solirubrobacterales bacterium]